MTRPSVFIDGSYGTTGLRIRDWLSDRDDIEILQIAEDQRRDEDARRNAMNEADLVCLCLPDDAAVEAVSWVKNESTRVIDASTAHRLASGWSYGLPELSPQQRESIRSQTRVSTPGCYPTGVILSIRPLIEAGLLDESLPLTVHALSGYTGGGKSLIAEWEDSELGLAGLPYESPYAVNARHKHIPEMAHYSGLADEPQFLPSVGPFATGMRVELPLHKSVLRPGATAQTIWETLSARYAGEKFVRVLKMDAEAAFSSATTNALDGAFDPRKCNDTNRLEIAVVPNPLGHVLIVILLDNLGKGASGATIQNMNLMLGLVEDTGLPA